MISKLLRTLRGEQDPAEFRPANNDPPRPVSNTRARDKRLIVMSRSIDRTPSANPPSNQMSS